MANFQAVAEQSILAGSINGNVHAGVTGFITQIRGARNPVIAIDLSARRALRIHTLFRSVAMQTIITVGGCQTFDTGVR